MATTSLRSRVWPWAVFVGVLSALLSLGRLWLGNRQAITENLWAEDGLFALCVAKTDIVSCTVDPYAGYLPFTPRVLSGVVATTPIPAWPLTANLLAAGLVGLAAALVWAIARRAGLGVIVSAIVAVIPAVAPISGLEALNSISHSFSLLLYVSTLALALKTRGPDPRGIQVVVAVVLFVTALTIPSAFLLLIVLVVQWFRRVVGRRQAAVWGAALIAGLIPQFVYVGLLRDTRPNYASGETLAFWADSVPLFLLTYWPGLSLTEFSFHTEFTLSPSAFTGALVTLSLVGLGLWLVITGWGRPEGLKTPVGLMIVMGAALSFVPSLTSYASNRYFVVAVWLLGAAVLIAANRFVVRRNSLAIAWIAVFILIIWAPAFPASEYRATPDPLWSTELAAARAECRASPDSSVALTFTPEWPYEGNALAEPTSPVVPCAVLLR